ncbi:MAG TPA: HEAT repeat domain-containing protein [Ktedonobacteraceae bacterium]|jgi:hypothetical protein
MSELAQRIQVLQQRLYQEGELEDLLTILREIDLLISEHATEDSYDLLTHAYRALSNATDDDPSAAHELILQRLLPWLIGPDIDENAERAQGSCRRILSDWLNQYPEVNRQAILQAILDVLANTLQTQPTAALCWVIINLGYRRPDLVSGLWELVSHNNDQLGDVALRVLVRLSVQGSDRRRLLEELHQRVLVRTSIPLLGALSNLADVSSIPVMQQCLNTLHANNELLLAQKLALRVLIDIADAHDTDSVVQKDIWRIIATLYESDPSHYEFDIYLSDITSLCNDPHVPLDLIRWLEKHSEDSEKERDRRRLLYLRLAECVRPHQLAEWSFNPSKALTIIRHDACRNSQSTGRWSTQESYTKQRAWDILLFLGDSSVLSSTQFKQAVVEEASGYLRGEVMELLACFHWRRLPEKAVTWITERVDLHQETASQELSFRRGAEHLARSSGTRQAFDALLAFGMTFDGEALRETADALASVSLTLAKKGEPRVVEMLLETIEHGEEERYRIAAMQALAWIASNDLFPPENLPRILAVLQENKRGDFELSRLVHILGMMPRVSLAQSTLDLLRNLASSDQKLTATSAIEALAQSSALLEMPDLIEKQLSLYAVGEQWDCQSASQMGYWMVGMICTLYSHDPKRFAPAVATLLESLGMLELPILLRALNDIHDSKHQPIPEEVQAALLSRLEQLQEEVFITPTELLQTCVRLLPNEFVERAWDRQLGTWRPETRASLAEALEQGLYTTEAAQERAIKHLLLLLHDAQYKVRRVGYRSLAAIAPRTLLRASVAWTYSPVMELRRRAAEALSWFSPIEDFWSEADHLMKVLASDPDPLVREALTHAVAERRQRAWAGEYLAQVRRTYSKSNKARLAVWRYAHALTLTGDDSTIADLKVDLVSSQLAPHERQWLRWMVKSTQEHWKKRVDKWPEPWFTWTGTIIFERGQVTLADNSQYDGTFFLYQEDNSGDALQNATWSGSFWPNTSISIPELRTMAFTLVDGHRGQATVKDKVSSEVCLLEGISGLV